MTFSVSNYAVSDDKKPRLCVQFGIGVCLHMRHPLPGHAGRREVEALHAMWPLMVAALVQLLEAGWEVTEMVGDDAERTMETVRDAMKRGRP